MAKLKVQEATVDDGSNYHELLKDEQKRFQESRAPKMSDLTTEDFVKLVGGGAVGTSIGFTLDDIRAVVKEEFAAALEATKPESVSIEHKVAEVSGAEPETKNTDTAEDEQSDRVVKQELSDASSSTAEPAKGKAK